MKASEYIKMLRALVDEHGDIRICRWATYARPIDPNAPRLVALDEGGEHFSLGYREGNPIPEGGKVILI